MAEVRQFVAPCAPKKGIRKDIWLLDFAVDPDMPKADRSTYLYWQDEIYRSEKDAELRTEPCLEERPDTILEKRGLLPNPGIA